MSFDNTVVVTVTVKKERSGVLAFITMRRILTPPAVEQMRGGP
jgi:hypothetical protein